MSKKWKLEKKPGDVCWDEIVSTTITNDEMVKAMMSERGLIETDNKLRSALWDAIIRLLPKEMSKTGYFWTLGDDIICRHETYARALTSLLEDMGFDADCYYNSYNMDVLYGYWSIYKE